MRAQLPQKRDTAPNFRPMSIVAKQSPMSAIAELLLQLIQVYPVSHSKPLQFMDHVLSTPDANSGKWQVLVLILDLAREVLVLKHQILVLVLAPEVMVLREKKVLFTSLLPVPQIQAFVLDDWCML